MAVADSNTTYSREIICLQTDLATDIATRLKKPLGVTMDLFQVLDGCQQFIDALMMSHDITQRMALCGRLYAGLEVLKRVMKAPLPDHLIQQLTTDAKTASEYRSPLTQDAETVCEYCAALTMLLLQQQQSPEQEETVSDMLCELFDLLITDLKAPRFIRTETGLTMIGGGETGEVH